MTTFIIAEAGVNHNGSFDMAKKLIDVAKECGADAVKFQTFKTEEVIVKNTPKCQYQIEQTGSDESQFDLIKKLQLSYDQKKELFNYGKKIGITVLSTAFDEDSLDFLLSIGMDKIKIASGEITNYPYLLKAARSQKPIILSTGMATLTDIETALEVISYGYLNEGTPESFNDIRKAYLNPKTQKLLAQKVTLLHCTTNYPALPEELNLNVLDTMKSTFKLNVGYSDHSLGHLASCIAVSKGATVIEKHFTLDRNLPGPDHQASLSPQDLKDLVTNIRLAEKMLGHDQKIPSIQEFETSLLVRRSLFAGENINVGDTFNAKNLKVKRPGNGLSPRNYWDLLGKKSSKKYSPDEMIEL